jgi:hypothetical protein
MGGTVLFLGAGATKSVDGPMTDEILPAMYAAKARIPAGDDPQGRVGQLVKFLETTFNVRPDLPKEQYPSLPLLMSLLDRALDRREDVGDWDVTALTDFRAGLELGIFDVLEDALNKFRTKNHYGLLAKLFPAGAPPQVITTNYDLVVDSALMYLSRDRQSPGLPEYHCALANLAIVPPPLRYGTILKLHGSLNWLFCRRCQRLELGATESTRFLDIFDRIAGKDLKEAFRPDGAPCSVCDRKLLPLLVAPSHLKDYRNPHLSLVWYEAQRVLRQADKIVFIGYSLPDDDVEVVYLLKRSLAHIKNARNFTVVEYCSENPAIALTEHSVGRRYRALFGDVDWYAGGVDSWLATQSN